MRLSVLFALLLSITMLMAGCARQKEYHYWQKQDPSSSLYLRGVKAQQMLEQDIAECVHIVIELTKLGDVRGNVPAMMQSLGSYDQKEATKAMSKLPYWDVPEYIRELRVDHTDFHDFDGCMAHKGWDRVKYIAPEAERRANQIYDDTAHYSVRPLNPKDAAYQREINSLENGRRKD